MDRTPTIYISAPDPIEGLDDNPVTPVVDPTLSIDAGSVDADEKDPLEEEIARFTDYNR